MNKSDKTLASYMRALVYLKQGDVRRALPEIEVLQHACAREQERQEAGDSAVGGPGVVPVQDGFSPEAGLKLLSRAVDV